MASPSCSVSIKGYEARITVHESKVNTIKFDLSEAAPEIIEGARALDVHYDLWTARIIRWVKYNVSQKSLICGIKWEDKQDENHAHETYGGWQARHMPGYRVICSQGGIPSWPTEDLNSEELLERDYAQAAQDREKRFYELEAKHDAGIALSEGEQQDFECGLERYYPAEESGNDENVAGSGFWHQNLGGNLSILERFTPKKPAQDDSSDFDDESQYSRSSLATTVIQQPLDWGLPNREPTLCDERIEHRFHLCMQYEDGKRGKDYKFPCGIGKHVRARPAELDSRVSVVGDDVLNNMPSTNPRDAFESGAQIKRFDVFASDATPHLTPERVTERLQEIQAAAIDLPADDSLDYGLPQYSYEVCHKDNSWLVEVCPEVTKEMIMLQNEAVSASSKNDTSRALETLNNYGIDLGLITLMVQMTLGGNGNFDMPGIEGILHARLTAFTALEILGELSHDLDALLPVVKMFLKDSKLCKAIHKELVDRDIGFLQSDDGSKDFRFHGRVETVLNNLHRWASDDIESAIEDIRLILQDEELLVEIIEAFYGSPTQHDRPLIDPKGNKDTCAQCGQDMTELGAIYGRDHSTLITSGCRVCEELRMRRAYKLLWKWRKNSDLLDDEQYEKIFGVPKGFSLPKRNEEKSMGNFDLEEEEE